MNVSARACLQGAAIRIYGRETMKHPEVPSLLAEASKASSTLEMARVFDQGIKRLALQKR